MIATFWGVICGKENDQVWQFRNKQVFNQKTGGQEQMLK